MKYLIKGKNHLHGDILKICARFIWDVNILSVFWKEMEWVTVFDYQVTLKNKFLV